jgi:hypothetical protein
MSIGNQAMMVELNIGNCTANKLDRSVSEEVDQQKGTTLRAGNYRKNILAGSKELERINKFVGTVRYWHYKQTIPWSDSGLRLLTLKRYVAYTEQLNAYVSEFDQLKRDFVTAYPNLISNAAFALGGLFNRDEYPSPDQVERKFYFNVNYYPLPEAGDFRIDAGNEMKDELMKQYESHYTSKLDGVMADLWERLHTTLQHLANRLEVSESGEKKIFRDSLIGNAQELCGMLSDMNVTNDPKLEAARKELEQAILGVTAKDLRDSVLVRHDVHTRVSEIIKKFEI